MVRDVKLAFRMVLAWRSSVYAAVGAIFVAAAILTFAGAVVAPVTSAVREAYRVRLTGELSGAVPAARIESIRRVAEEVGALVSIRTTEAAALDAYDRFSLVRLVRVDLPRELAFRRLDALVAESDEPIGPADSVLLADRGPASAGGDPAGARADSSAGGDAASGGAPSSAGGSGLISTRTESGLTRILAVGPGGPDGAQLLIHDPPLEDRPEDRPDVLTVVARGRGRPLGRRARELTHLGLQPTGWTDEARRRLAPVRGAVIVLAAVLAALAAGTLVPGHLLLARRSREAIGLLGAWGFSGSRRAQLTALTGGIASGLAGLAGSGVAIAVASVLNAQGRVATDLLPGGIVVRLAPVLASPPVAPSLVWMIAVVAAATLLGVVTALPSAWIAATLHVRRGLWHR